MDDSKIKKKKKVPQKLIQNIILFCFSTQCILITTTTKSILPTNEQFNRIADNAHAYF